MDKQEIVNELSQLYRLRDEGKKVDYLIKEMEALLYLVMNEELSEVQPQYCPP